MVSRFLTDLVLKIFLMEFSMNDLPSPMGGQLLNFLGNFYNEPGLNVLTLKFEV